MATRPARELWSRFSVNFIVPLTFAETYWWELVEMLRKLILTSLLVVIYNGSAPHLVASLITTFIFIIAHLKVLYAISPCIACASVFYSFQNESLCCHSLQ